MDKKPFYIDEIRPLINQFNNKEISIAKLNELLNEKAADFYGFAPAEPTEHGHETIKLKAIPGYDVSDHNPVRYIRSEYNLQIIKMKSLGINTQEQMFEQCVNALLYMVADLKKNRS